MNPFLADSPDREMEKIKNSVSDMPALSKEHECFQTIWDEEDE